MQPQDDPEEASGSSGAIAWLLNDQTDCTDFLELAYSFNNWPA
jgi:hypothetical protein